MIRKKPPVLKPGDKVGIVSPARFVEPSEIAGGIAWIERIGFKPVLGKHVFGREDQFAGNDKNRAEDLIRFLDDPEIKCIIATRGGYGSVRLIPYLNGLNPSINPKWFVGYSDMTVFHSWLGEKFNLQTIHGPMLFSMNYKIESIKSFEGLEKILKGERFSSDYALHDLNRGREMEGVLTGGNLSILYSLRGSDLDLDVKDKILFIEDLDEYLYHIDRIMQNFKRSGWLEKISGLLVGGMDKMNDNQVPFGKTAEEIISSVSSDYSFPVFFNHPSGHGDYNLPLIFGERIRLEKKGDLIEYFQ